MKTQSRCFAGAWRGKHFACSRLIARFALREVGKSPAAGRGVSFLILDHELSVHGGPGKGAKSGHRGNTGGARGCCLTEFTAKVGVQS